MKTTRKTLRLVAMTLSLTMATGALIAPARAGLVEGIAAYEAGNAQLAAKEFRAGADKGDADCQFNLGLMHEQGMGIAKNEKEAVFWYQKAGELGNANAQFNLGVLYENGRGTGVDFARANQWYRKAAVQGDALAIGNLGMLYLRGDGVKMDKIAGVALLLQSATMDSSSANNAKTNLAATKGLTPDMVAAAQELLGEMVTADNLLIPLDRYLKSRAGNAAGSSI